MQLELTRIIGKTKKKKDNISAKYSITSNEIIWQNFYDRFSTFPWAFLLFLVLFISSHLTCGSRRFRLPLYHFKTLTYPPQSLMLPFSSSYADFHRCKNSVKFFSVKLSLLNVKTIFNAWKLYSVFVENHQVKR